MQRAGVALVVVVLLICMINALLYTMWIANPVIRSDAWFFLSAFVSKHLDGSLQWADYFVKRGPSDHSQPLFKLLLVLNTDWFALDFLYESLVGFIGMVACCLYLIMIALGALQWRPQPAEVCLVNLIPLLLFSLNSREIYAWSLVILFYFVLPLALLLFSLSHGPGSAWRLAAIFFATVICLVVMDNGGRLVCLVAIAALALEALRGSGWRSAVVRMLPIVAGLVLYHWTYTSMFAALPSMESQSGGILNVLIAQGSQAWKWAILPAAASLVHLDAFVVAMGQQGYAAMMTVGVIVVALHAAFWLSVFRTPAGRYATFMAVCLMLFVYSATAGVVLVRVPEFGWDYLLQHRYVATYQLANVALVLQWLGARNSSVETTPARMDGHRSLLRRLLPVATFAVVAVVQWSLSIHAWNQAPYIRAYHQAMAQTVFCLASHPEIEAPVCQPLHPVCGWQPEIRNRLVGILKDHQLNVFSKDFQLRHGMQPDPDAHDCCVESYTASGVGTGGQGDLRSRGRSFTGVQPDSSTAAAR